MHIHVRVREITNRARTATPFKRESQIKEKTKMAVEKVKGAGQSPSPTDKLETLAERIRKRAFEIFENQGADGRAVKDWLVAKKGDANAFSDLCAALRSRNRPQNPARR
jgi:hypothetical protein